MKESSGGQRSKKRFRLLASIIGKMVNLSTQVRGWKKISPLVVLRWRDGRATRGRFPW